VHAHAQDPIPTQTSGAAPAQGQAPAALPASAQVPGTPGAPSAPQKASKPSNPKGNKRPREKEIEGTEARDRFQADTVLKSKYQSNGEQLEVDPD
jgi:hypothetical protein